MNLETPINTNTATPRPMTVASLQDSMYQFILIFTNWLNLFIHKISFLQLTVLHTTRYIFHCSLYIFHLNPATAHLFPESSFLFSVMDRRRWRGTRRRRQIPGVRDQPSEAPGDRGRPEHWPGDHEETARDGDLQRNGNIYIALQQHSRDTISFMYQTSEMTSPTCKCSVVPYSRYVRCVSCVHTPVTLLSGSLSAFLSLLKI